MKVYCCYFLKYIKIRGIEVLLSTLADDNYNC